MKIKKIITVFIAVWFSLGNKNKVFAKKFLKSETLSIKNERQLIEEQGILFEEEELKETAKKLKERIRKLRCLIDNLNTLRAYILITNPFDLEDAKSYKSYKSYEGYEGYEGDESYESDEENESYQDNEIEEIEEIDEIEENYGSGETSENVKVNKKEEILLSLISEARLDAEETIAHYRERKSLLIGTARQRIMVKRNRLTTDDVVRSNNWKAAGRRYRDSNTYSVEDGFGYKSLCPIFFDRFSAETFLIKATRKTFFVMRNLDYKYDTDLEILDGFSNTKVKVVRLGNLLEYLTKTGNETFFEKFEFLFVPHLSSQNNLTGSEKRKINRITRGKKFGFYQKQFIKLHEEIKEMEVEQMELLKEKQMMQATKKT